MPGNENTKPGILQGLFICHTSELNLRSSKLLYVKVVGALSRSIQFLRLDQVWISNNGGVDRTVVKRSQE